jgi:hypothetical protein
MFLKWDKKSEKEWSGGSNEGMIPVKKGNNKARQAASQTF